MVCAAGWRGGEEGSTRRGQHKPPFSRSRMHASAAFFGGFIRADANATRKTGAADAKEFQSRPP
jgi:hypothetical protein